MILSNGALWRSVEDVVRDAAVLTIKRYFDKYNIADFIVLSQTVEQDLTRTAP
ncbi:hypothetical protein EMCG_00626 [[Emmonsia] crescens]|uniref:Uncharacterized protein n=1 Tax=[Emmonsia] crescens TaxID=73230 RepID=A0A0G2HSP4_9EURO|nr:hypothetical protein EMCG_00626 [Emmonsia crescens UAMH 3008]